MPTAGRQPALSTYRALFEVGSMRALTAATTLARLGGTMWSLALVLYALEHFHSPGVAGAATFFSRVPGLLATPLAGALLDRHSRVHLIAIDLGVAITTVVAIIVLDRSAVLTPQVFVAVVAVGSITLPLTSTGTRSLMPLLTPPALWERMNAVDSASAEAAQVLGPAAAGLLFATVGASAMLLAIGVLWLGALLLLTRVTAPRPAAPAGRLLGEALGGLAYTLRNPVLRGLTIVFPLANVGAGVFTVALPVLVLGRTHGGGGAVGALWSAFGLAALVAGLLFGGVRTAGWERPIIAVAFALSGAGLFLVALAGLLPATLLLAGVGMVGAGGAIGPCNVAMYSLRQRTTDPAWFGRAISISMSVNAFGVPVGAAIGGSFVAVAPIKSMVAGAAVSVIAGALCFGVLPRGRSRQ